MSDHVSILDLRDAEQAERLRERSIVEALSQAGGPTREHPGSGVVRPFSIVVIDEARRATANADIYAQLALPSMTLKIIVVMLADDESSIKGTVLPRALDSGAINILWVSNPAGTAWVPGTAIADGIGTWPHDPTGGKALESLIDTLSIPEVFSEVFESMRSHASAVHTIGLRRWVFSLEAGQSIDDFVHEAGVRIAGDRGIDPSRDEPRFWTLPPELTGEAESDSVFTPIEGSVVDLLKKAERRVGALHRLTKEGDPEIASHSREELIGAAEACGDAFDELVDRGVKLVEQVDASDGIDQSEHAAVKKLGVNLHPGYDAPPLLNVSDDMLESVVWDLEQGHSLEPLLGRLSADAEAVKVPSRIDRVAELQTFKKSKARKRLKSAEDRFPDTVWAGLLGTNWRSFIDWRLSILVGSVIALVALGMAYVSSVVTPDKGLDMGCAVDSVCAASRGFFGWDGWTGVFIVLLMLVALAVPVLIFGIRQIASKVREWAGDLGIGRLVKESREIRERVATIVLNDWVLAGYRNQAESMLSTARDTFDSISRVVSDRMVNDDVKVTSTLSVQHVNPQIEQNLNVQAGAILYRAFSPIVELIRLDVIALITRTVRSFWPRLQAKSGDQLPEQVAAAIDVQLEEYLSSLDPETLLDASTGDREADRRRRIVLEQLWQDKDIVAGTIEEAVEAGSATEMLQMVSLADLSVLETSSQSPKFIRFTPSLARKQVDELSAARIDRPHVVLTDRLTCAGVLRLVPVRDGVVEFDLGDDENQSAA